MDVSHLFLFQEFYHNRVYLYMFYFILIWSHNSLVIAKWWLYDPVMTDPVAERLWDNFISIELMQNYVVHWLHQAGYWCCDYITVICCRSFMSTQRMATLLCLDYESSLTARQ